MKEQAEIKKLFQCLNGGPCWRTWRGHAASLFFNFGDPELEIRDAIPDSDSPALRVPDASVVGQHGLQLCGYWKIYENEKIISSAAQTNQQIDSTTRYLDGRTLEKIYINSDFGHTTFYFNYNLEIAVAPYLSDMNEPTPDWTTPEEWQEILASKDELWILDTSVSGRKKYLSFYENGNFESETKGGDIVDSFTLQNPLEIVVR